MKKFIKFFNILLLLFLCAKGYGQGKTTTNTELHFLVDTASRPSGKKLIKIWKSTPFAYSFTFNCNCMKPLGSFSFFYSTEKKYPTAPIVDKKPDHKYITWDELRDIVIKSHNWFDGSYDLYITEVLPGNKYRTNKVTYAKTSTVE